MNYCSSVTNKKDIASLLYNTVATINDSSSCSGPYYIRPMSYGIKSCSSPQEIYI